MIIYKGYQVKVHKELPMHHIIVTDGVGGKIPNALTGMFTSQTTATTEIDKYLETKTKKEV